MRPTRVTSSIAAAVLAVLAAACVPIKDADADAGASGGAAAQGGAGGAAGTPAIDRTGRWIGVTSLQRMFEVTIADDALTSVRFDLEFDGTTTDPNIICHVASHNQTEFTIPVPLRDDGEVDEGPFGTDIATYVLSGAFPDGRSASGMVQASYANRKALPICTASLLFDWQIVHVVCGDGVVDWPETCDDGTTNPDAGCSETCELPATPEKEPNDTIEEAGPPITADAVLTGALATGGDADVYAIRNSRAAPVAVALETQGQAPGVCDTSAEEVDTMLDLLDGDGALIASNDDGSRTLHCSYLSQQIPAGATFYARVSSAQAKPISAYVLIVRFQKR
jgi:cysteine-rich repeat protein